MLAFVLIISLAFVGFSADLVPENPPEGWSLLIMIVTPSEQAKGDSFKLSDIMAITVYDGDTVALGDSYFSKQPKIRKADDILKDKIKSKELAGKLYNEARILINNKFQLEEDPDFKDKVKNQSKLGTIAISMRCAGREVRVSFSLPDMKNLPENLKNIHVLAMESAVKIKDAVNKEAVK